MCYILKYSGFGCIAEIWRFSSSSAPPYLENDSANSVEHLERTSSANGRCIASLFVFFSWKHELAECCVLDESALASPIWPVSFRCLG